MDLPQRLKIGGFEYSVVLEENFAAGTHYFGLIKPMTQEIVLDKRLHPTRYGETLLHEIVEAINNHCELDLEHRQISALAFQLHQVLRDNRLVFFD